MLKQGRTRTFFYERLLSSNSRDELVKVDFYGGFMTSSLESQPMQSNASYTSIKPMTFGAKSKTIPLDCSSYNDSYKLYATANVGFIFYN